jgi:hypothetical protein
MLVTVSALAVGKVIGLASAASLWRVGVGRLLPWRGLMLTAAVCLAAAVPAVAVGYELQAPPLIRMLVVGIVYGAAYAGAAFAAGLLSAQERAALSREMGRLQFMLPVRYQHKTS